MQSSKSKHLTKVGTFLWDSEVALLIGAAEKSCVVHEICISVVRFAATEGHPEEIIWFVPFSEDLQCDPRLHQNKIKWNP